MRRQMENIMLELGLATQEGQLRFKSGGLSLVTENMAFSIICVTSMFCKCNTIQSSFRLMQRKVTEQVV